MPKTSPLDAAHRALGAKMGAFAGWDMPISYAGTLSEHENVRARAGIFDVSHLGKLLVTGARAAEFLDSQLTNRMTDLLPGRARYTLICDENAGIVDDLIVYVLPDGRHLVVPNAGNRDAVFERLRDAAPADVNVEVLDWTTLAVQGPRAPEIVGARFPFAKELGYMHVGAEGGVVVARSGYTGERGFEVFTAAADGSRVWNELLEGVRAAGGGACGLAARDTLRLEMGYPLHGNDIDRTTTPAEAGLTWAVKLAGREFPGARALRESEPKRRLAGIRMHDKVIPRAHCAVLRFDQQIGETTSGTLSPTLRQGIALAYVRADDAVVGAPVDVEVRGKRGHGEIVDPPFVARSPK
jgi:aminomethyltransferase